MRAIAAVVPAVGIALLAAACSSSGRPAAHSSGRVTTSRGANTTTSTAVVTTTSAATTTTTAPRPTTTTTTTRTPASTSAPTGHGLRGVVITLNPGHDGGNGSHPIEINRQVWIGSGYKACDTAGTETASGYTEHAFNWDVALRAAAKLRALGATVVLTRTTDAGVGPCIDERAAIGNRAHSAAVVNIHADGGPVSGRGFFVIAPTLIRGLTDDVYTPSSRLAADVRDAVRQGTPMPTADYAGSDGYLTSGIYGGLNLANVPAMFIECGNMQNATDAALLESPAFRDQLATAIVAGIRTFVG